MADEKTMTAEEIRAELVTTLNREGLTTAAAMVGAMVNQLKERVRSAEIAQVAAELAGDALELDRDHWREAARLAELNRARVEATEARLRSALERVIENDGTRYDHHQVRYRDGKPPAAGGGTIWLTPTEIARAVLKETK